MPLTFVRVQDQVCKIPAINTSPLRNTLLPFRFALTLEMWAKI